MTTPQWTVDDDGTLWFEPGDGGALEPWEALPQTATGQIAQPHFDAAYDALVADVAAARLVDDMAAVVRRYEDHWRPSLRDPGWWVCDRPRPSPYRKPQRMEPGEVAALHHARRQEGT